ncbi:MAG: ABC transporter permease [Dermatophilaceae bacterium]
MIASVWTWLTEPANWSGAGGIGIRLIEHLRYSAVVLVIAAGIAIPLGLWAGHSGRGRWLITSANAARAVPTIGLLFAVSLWLGPHIHGDLAFTIPSVLVLVLLAIPPILAGAYAGVEAVDPAVRDAARGMGLTGPEVLRRVEVPIALPLMLSGVRSAVLQVVATATVAAYVGLGGLGRFLIDGLASARYDVMAGGAILVAALALAADLVMAGIQRVVVSPGLRATARGGKQRRSRRVDRSGLEPHRLDRTMLDGTPPDVPRPTASVDR